MNIEFTKMHGAGNDFIMIDESKLPNCILPSSEQISFLCHRKRGIGADGLIVLSRNYGQDFDFKMFFFNSDGGRESMCGNGLRCASLYAYKYFNLGRELKVQTDSGVLCAEIISDCSAKIEIPYKEKFREVSVEGISLFFGNTGVPHAVIFADKIDNIDIVKKGRFIRYHKEFQPRGTNVNFVSPIGNSCSNFLIRTYEKGVEDETLACGTGISASAICASLFREAGHLVKFQTVSGDALTVEIPGECHDFDKVFLAGPAVEVFSGKTNCQI